MTHTQTCELANTPECHCSCGGKMHGLKPTPGVSERISSESRNHTATVETMEQLSMDRYGKTYSELDTREQSMIYEEASDPAPSGKPLGTTHRGSQKVYSERQMGYLEAHHIDHTHFVYDENGRLVRKSRHTWEHEI